MSDHACAEVDYFTNGATRPFEILHSYIAQPSTALVCTQQAAATSRKPMWAKPT